MNLETTLEEYGLKERHAKIYLACLELGSAPILKIAQQSGFARSTCEAVLERLQQEGFVSSFRKRRTRYFSPEDPHQVVALAKAKAQSLERVLPQFMAAYGKNKVRPTVRFYQGKQGMHLILQELLQEAKELLAFSEAEDLFSVLEDYPEFVQRRLALKIPARVILKNSPKAQERQKLGPQQLRQVKIISENYNYHGMMLLWKNKIAMFSFKQDLTALLIESQELYQMQETMFEFLWKTLP